MITTDNEYFLQSNPSNNKRNNEYFLQSNPGNNKRQKIEAGNGVPSNMRHLWQVSTQPVWGLPNDLWIHTFSLLPTCSMPRLARVCKQFYCLVNHSLYLKEFLSHDFGELKLPLEVLAKKIDICGTQLRQVNFFDLLNRGIQPVENTDKLLEACPYLEKAVLIDSLFTPSAIHQLVSKAPLKEFAFLGYQNPDKRVIEAIGSSSTLKRIHLASIDNEGLDLIALNTRLESVMIDSCQEATHDRVALLIKNTSLSELGITEAHITDSTIEPLVNCIKLRKLVLNLTNVGSFAMRSLAALSQLAELHLRYCREVNDAAAADLALCPSLTFLDITATSITEVGLNSFTSLTTLRELHLYGNRVGDSEGNAICKLSSLRKLSLRASLVMQSIAGIAKMSLTELDLSQCPLIHHEAVKLTSCHSLVKIDLSQTLVNDVTALDLAKLPKLREINLDETPLGPFVVQELLKKPALKVAIKKPQARPLDLFGGSLFNQ